MTPMFIMAASMMTQAGSRPSSASRSMRRSIAPASLNGTATVMSLTDLRDTRAVRQRRNVLAVAQVVVRHADTDHGVVVMPVIRPEDLHDGVAPGVGARDAHGVHGRFGAGVHIAPERQTEALGQRLADDDRVLDRGGEMRSLGDPFGNRLDDGRMRVPLHHRAEAVVVVDPLVAVDIPDLGALAFVQVDRPGIAHLVGRRHAARHGLFRALVHPARPRGRVVQPLFFLGGQLCYAAFIDLQSGSDNGHASALWCV